MKRKLLPVFLGLLSVPYLSLFAKPAAACSAWQLTLVSPVPGMVCLSSQWLRRKATDVIEDNISDWTQDMVVSVADSLISTLTGHESMDGYLIGRAYRSAGQTPPETVEVTTPDNVTLDLPIHNGTTPVGPQSRGPDSYGGALGALQVGLSGLQETQPLNLALYVDQLKQDSPLPLIQRTAYAQNEGLSILGLAETAFLATLFEGSILNIWTKVRDIAYALAVVMLVIMGFMVMFRYRGRAREAFNITQALPRIALGLLLITFSYPIGALSIQLMRVGVLAAQAALAVPVLDVLASLDSIASLLAGPGGDPMGLFLIVMGVLLILAFILLLFAIFLTTLSRYIKLIIMTIAAPLVFLIGMLPGQDEVIKTWFKGWLANTLAIPAIFAMLYLAEAILLSVTVLPPWEVGAFGFAKLYASQMMVVMLAFGVLWKARSAPKAIDNMLQAESWAGIKKKLK